MIETITSKFHYNETMDIIRNNISKIHSNREGKKKFVHLKKKIHNLFPKKVRESSLFSIFKILFICILSATLFIGIISLINIIFIHKNNESLLFIGAFSIFTVGLLFCWDFLGVYEKTDIEYTDINHIFFDYTFKKSQTYKDIIELNQEFIIELKDRQILNQLTCLTREALKSFKPNENYILLYRMYYFFQMYIKEKNYSNAFMTLLKFIHIYKNLNKREISYD